MLLEYDKKLELSVSIRGSKRFKKKLWCNAWRWGVGEVLDAVVDAVVLIEIKAGSHWTAALSARRIGENLVWVALCTHALEYNISHCSDS